MKKIAIVFVFCLAACGAALAQSSLSVFEKAREIKILESTLNDVQRIFVNFEAGDFDDDLYEQWFYGENVSIRVLFSSGDCSDDSEYWNVRKLTATKASITFKNPVKIEDFKFDFSSFKKEIEDEESSDDYIYQNENSGILFDIHDHKIERIILFPSKSHYSSLCKNEKTEKIFSKEKRVIDLIQQGEIVCRYVNPPANVEEVKLSKNEITIGAKISVTTIARDPDNDVLTYNYTVSAGRIIGQGENVTWDLTGAGA